MEMAPRTPSGSFAMAACLRSSMHRIIRLGSCEVGIGAGWPAIACEGAVPGTYSRWTKGLANERFAATLQVRRERMCRLNMCTDSIPLALGRGRRQIGKVPCPASPGKQKLLASGLELKGVARDNAADLAKEDLSRCIPYALARNTVRRI